MPPTSPTVVLAAPLQVSTADLREFLADAGYTVTEVPLGTHERVDFAQVAAVVVAAGETLAFAAAQTRLWRVEMGDHPVPIVWVLPFASADLTVSGLDAGADVVLTRPVDPCVFAAQLRAALRSRDQARGLLARAAEARQLNGQLQRAYAEIDRAFDLARRVQRAWQPRTLPAVDTIRFGVHHRPRSRVGGDIYDVCRLDEEHVGFWLADVGGPGTPAGGLLGLVVRQAVVLKEIHANGYRLIPPDEVLTRVNRELLALDLDPPALVGMACGQVNTRTGRVTVARGGLPLAVHVTATGNGISTDMWAGPGPHLGAYEAEFPPQCGHLAAGDRLLLMTDGVRPVGDPDPLPDILARHAGLSAQAFAEAVVRDSLGFVAEPDDCTLLMAEGVHDPDSAIPSSES